MGGLGGRVYGGVSGGVWGYEGEEDQRELTASLTQHFSSSFSYFCCTILIKRFKTFFIIEPQSYSSPAGKIIDLCAVRMLVKLEETCIENKFERIIRSPTSTH